MTVPFSTGKTISINQLTGVDITDVANNNVLQYNSTNDVWDNGGLDLSGADINLDEIDCRVLRVSETADITGRLANQGVASFVNDEFIFQNGISNLGGVIYIDNVNNRVGINVAEPEEDLEVDGSIQIDSANVARLKFQQSGPSPHALSELDGEQDGTNGGDLQILTKVDGGSVTEKLRINNIGAIGISGANFGTAGAVLTSNGSTNSVSWNSPVLFTVYKSATSTTSNPVINWTTPEINIGGGSWDGAGTYTVGLAGFYDINFQAQMRTQTPNSNGNFIAIRQNGTIVSSANHEMVNVGGTEEYINMYISRLIYLNINDAITTSATIKNSGEINNSFLKIIRVANF